MNVIYLLPEERISRFVQSILVIENNTVFTPFQLPLFANGAPTLLFLTTPGEISNISNQLTLFGQTVRPTQMLISRNFKLVAYFLHPYALSALFNLSASELTDRPIALDLVTGASELYEQLLDAVSTNQVIQLLNDYIYSMVKAITFEDSRLIYAVKKIRSNSNKNILKDIQHELYLTERTFQRLFEQHIGVSPNMFRRINKFSKAFRQINQGYVTNFTTLAYDNGYADQSHFIKAFKEFTDLTPSKFMDMSKSI